ncbi:SsgA family sporulation/cell division regulator [Streptomyces sp. NPDC008222]|uniref:SsgA family sporulation/cell division regulator n=1 Tax=Streptomyces sp. NPDC008222 TaxID=3364820 RepID=UPI0036E2C038
MASTLHTSKGEAIDLELRLHYASRDPLAVTLAIPDGSLRGVVWNIGRDLLSEGARAAWGLGRIRVFPIPPDGTDMWWSRRASGRAPHPPAPGGRPGSAAGSHGRVPPRPPL